MPRMLRGAAQRDVLVELFGTRFPTPLMLAPVGVIGICDPDGHGDLLTARAAATTGVPIVASTLMQAPLADADDALGETTGWIQRCPPKDRYLRASFVPQPASAG